MSNILRKPYQISIWEDRIYYIYNKNGIVYESDYLPSTGTYTILNEFTKEFKIAVIGSNTMDSPIKAVNPILTENLNGSNTFSFQIPYKYYNEEINDFSLNPFTNLLVNERKIKLNYDGKWYDFIIKDIDEDSERFLFTYTAIDLYINELSKNGYNIQLDTELQNNMGTAEELGSLILEDTDWQIADSKEGVILSSGENLKSEIIQQTKIEQLFQYTLTEACLATDMRDKTRTKNIPAGNIIYIPHSSFSDGKETIQFFYEQNGFQVDSEGIILDATNWEAATPNDLYSKDDKDAVILGQFDLNKVSISYNYRGESLIKKQKTKYISNINKYCTIYKKDGEEYYSYFKTVYANPTEIQNILTNSSNFEVNSGWYASGACSVIPQYAKDPLNDNEVVSTMKLSFSSNGHIVNDGIFSNRGKLDAFTKGDKYYFAIKYCGDKKPITSAKVMAYYTSEDSDRVENKTYYYLNENRNYIQLEDDEDFDLSTTYFEGQEILKLSEGTFITEGLEGVYEDLGGYVVYSNKITKSFSISEIKEKYDLVFEIFGEGDGNIIDVKFFKELLDNNGKLIVPNLTEEYSSIVKEKYHFFPIKQLEEINIESEEDLVYSDVCDFDEISDKGYKIVYSDNYEKITSITASKSNCFNLIQTLSENFECWAKFVIDHDFNGEVLYFYTLTKDTEVLPGKKYYTKMRNPSLSSIDGQYCFADTTSYNSPEGLLYERNFAKYVCFKKFIGQENFAGFRYGINLKSIKRSIDSNQIVTKMIVEPNANEHATNGFCSIQNSSLNSLGESVVYNFEYYIKKGLLSRENLYYDLYETDNHAIGYFVRTEIINRELQPVIEERIKLAEALDKYTSDYQTYDSRVSKAIEERAEVINAIANNRNISLELAEKIEYNVSANTSVINEYITKRDQLSYDIKTYTEALNRTRKLKKEAETKYEELFKKEQEARKKKIGIEREFYKKYSRYIQEGVWKSEDYYDPDLYYLDSLGVSYTSAFPQISYTINVLELSQVEGFEAYSFKIGDKTYIEDTDFFGWVENTGRPYQEEIVVSEIQTNLDDPVKNTIKVQNYKTQFEDLFQRMAATTQSLQYASGEFQRASNAINSNGTFEGSILKNSLYNNALILQNAKDQSVTWDETGITITSLSSPSEIVRLVSGGIMLTTDGGRNWTTGITGTGINANVITTGRLDTNRIRIFNDKAQTFEWNSTGINAYNVNQSGITEYGKFIRFDKWGIYSYIGGNPEYIPTGPDDIQNNSLFSLTKKGLCLRSINGSNQLTLRADDEANYMKILSNGYEIGIGILDIDNSTNLRKIIDANGKFKVYEDGSVIANNGTFTGDIDVQSLKINGKVAMTNDKISGTFLNLNGAQVSNSQGKTIFAVNTAEYPNEVYINGKINMSAGSVLDWGNITEDNWDKNKGYAAAAKIEGALGTVKNTYISGTQIRSPVIIGGLFRAQDDRKTQMDMKGTGLYLRSNAQGTDINEDKPGSSFFCVRYIGTELHPEYTLPTLLLGFGESETSFWRKGMIIKLSEGLWIGDSNSLTYDKNKDALFAKEWEDFQTTQDDDGTGFFLNFNFESIHIKCKYNGVRYKKPLPDFILQLAEEKALELLKSYPDNNKVTEMINKAIGDSSSSDSTS